MAIQIRRGNKSELDSSKLMEGEPVLCMDTDEVMIKSRDKMLTLVEKEYFAAYISDKLSGVQSGTTLYTCASEDCIANEAGTELQLSENLSSYDFIEIFYRAFTPYGAPLSSARAFVSENLAVALNAMTIDSTNAYGYFMLCGSVRYNDSQTALIVSSGRRVRINPSAVESEGLLAQTVENVFPFKIVKVIGYKVGCND